MAEIHPYRPGLQQTEQVFLCTGISLCRGKKGDLIRHTSASCSQRSSQKEPPLPSPSPYAN